LGKTEIGEIVTKAEGTQNN